MARTDHAKRDHAKRAEVRNRLAARNAAADRDALDEILAAHAVDAIGVEWLVLDALETHRRAGRL